MDKKFTERYSRHFPLSSIGKENQLKLKNRKVLVAGMGGLGTASSELLASIGVGYLRIIDFDVVEISNLPRQKLYNENDIGRAKVEVAEERLKLRNPDISIDQQPTRIDAISVSSLLDGIDLVIDGLDSFQSRKVLFRKSYQMNIPYVFCGAIAEHANLMVFTHDNDMPCLECVIGEIIDDKNQSCEVRGVHPSILQLATSIQVSEAVKVLLNQETELNGKMLLIDLDILDFDKVNFTKNDDCKLCGTNASSNELDEGKVGEITRGYKEIGSIGKALVTSLCGRDTRIIDPTWEIDWDFHSVKEIIKKNWIVKVDGDNYITFQINSVGISLLKSGVSTIRGAKTSKNAILQFTNVLESIFEK